jgi:hypothetical protein
MSPSDEIVKAEMSRIDRLVALGLGRYEAIKAVEAGLDRNTLERLDPQSAVRPEPGSQASV